MRISQSIKNFFRLSPQDQIDPQVRKNFKQNFIVNALDGSFWLLGESFVSVNTILPVFASTLTDSAIYIGLLPAFIHAGWFIPQLLMAAYVKCLPVKLPFTKKMAMVERIPYLVLPMSAFLLPWITEKAALWLFMILVAWRGFASGMVALPWQEVIANVIPRSVRSRFFGVTRTLGRILGVLGSGVAGFILTKFAYPNNFALCFVFGAVFIWISYIFFSQTIEVKGNQSEEQFSVQEENTTGFDFPAFRTILQKDPNFRWYLSSRAFFQMGSMATGFLAIYGLGRFSLPTQQAAVFSGLLFASGILGTAVWGVFGDQVGPRNILVVSDILQAMVLLLTLFANSLWAFYLVFLLVGLTQSGQVIGELILGMEIGGEADRPTYIGLARSVPGLFVLVSPLLGGVLVTWFGYRPMFLTALIFGLIGVLFLLKVEERKKTN